MTNNKMRKRKLLLKWTNEQTLILIAEVESKESLWNNALPHYNNRRVRDVLWEEIAEKMEMEKSEIVNKWNSIRNTFRMSLNKWKNTKNLEDYLAKTQSNEIFNRLMFLEPTLRFDDNGKISNCNDNGHDTDADNTNEIKAEEMEDSTSSQKSSFNIFLVKNKQNHNSPLTSASTALPPAEPVANSEELLFDEQIATSTQTEDRSFHTLRKRMQLKTSPLRTCGHQILAPRPLELLIPKLETSEVPLPMPLPLVPEQPQTASNVEKNSTNDDDWANIGKFIAMNGVRWSKNNPQRAARFRSGLYKLVYETDLEEMASYSSS